MLQTRLRLAIKSRSVDASTDPRQRSGLPHARATCQAITDAWRGSQSASLACAPNKRLARRRSSMYRLPPHLEYSHACRSSRSDQEIRRVRFSPRDLPLSPYQSQPDALFPADRNRMLSLSGLLSVMQNVDGSKQQWSQGIWLCWASNVEYAGASLTVYASQLNAKRASRKIPDARALSITKDDHEHESTAGCPSLWPLPTLRRRPRWRTT